MIIEYTHISKFTIGQRVNIDNDTSIKAIVTALQFTHKPTLILVEWFSNGDLKTAWVEEWRLTRIKE